MNFSPREIIGSCNGFKSLVAVAGNSYKLCLLLCMVFCADINFCMFPGHL